MLPVAVIVLACSLSQGGRQSLCCQKFSECCYVGMSSQSYPRMSGPPFADSSTVPAVNLVSTASRTSGEKRCYTSSSDANVGMRDLDHCMSVQFKTLSAAHLYTCLCFASCFAAFPNATD